MNISQHWVSESWTWNRDVMPKGYEEIEPVRIDMVRGRKGSVSYAVRQQGACMNAKGEWEFEPIPSSRTDEWLKEFRFSSWEDAAKAVERCVKTPLGRFHRMLETTP